MGFVKKSEVFLFVVLVFLFVFTYTSYNSDISARVILDSLSTFNAKVVSELGISNSPPLLNSSIPNQTWSSSVNNTDAFDLDDYFIDLETTLSYSYFGNKNITVSIDPLTNIVSFFQPTSFIGTDYVIFNATDGDFFVLSNNVTLTLTQDNQPPKWSNVRKNKATVFDSNNISFSSDWTDDGLLDSFVFSINQGSTWINSSSISLKGSSNTSIASTIIKGSNGTLIQWRFHAFDSFGNSNATDIQNFTISFKPSSNSGSVTASEALEEVVSKEEKEGGLTNFLIDPLALLFKVKEGSTITKILVINNTGTTSLPMVVSLEGIDFILSDTTFNMAAGSSKILSIEFDARKVKVGQYFGKITIGSGSIKRIVKTSVIVSKASPSFDVEIKVKDNSKNINAGDHVDSEITITNLGDIKESEVTLYYALQNFEGSIMDFNEEKISVNEKLTTDKSLKVPLEVELGEHLFYAKVTYGGEESISADIFTIGNRFKLLAKTFQSIFWIVLFLVLLIIITVSFVKYKQIRYRDKMLRIYLLLVELKKLLQKGKTEEAIEIYLQIKKLNKEDITNDLENKNDLKLKLEDLDQNLEKISIDNPNLNKEDISEKTPNKTEIKDSKVKKETTDKPETKKEN